MMIVYVVEQRLLFFIKAWFGFHRFRFRRFQFSPVPVFTVIIIVIIFIIIGPTVCVFGSTTMCLRKAYYVLVGTSLIICISISIICNWDIICICIINMSGHCCSVTTALPLCNRITLPLLVFVLVIHMMFKMQMMLMLTEMMMLVLAKTL